MILALVRRVFQLEGTASGLAKVHVRFSAVASEEVEIEVPVS